MTSNEAVFGVVDIGSNTVHLLVAASDGRIVRRLDDRSTHLRLGADLELTGAISEGKVLDTATTVLGYVERAEALGAREVRLLATQAVRAAANRAEVVEAIEAMSGVPVSVLEPEREAYLAVLGASLTRSWPEPHLVVDIGGASTQISVASSETLLNCRSAPIGSGRLATRFLHDPPSRAELAATEARIGAALTSALGVLPESGALPQGAVIVGGAVRRVARVVSPDGAPLRVTRGQLQGALVFLNSTPSPFVASVRGVEADRVPMARAGALILLQLLQITGLPECTISPFGIREGAILDSARAVRWQRSPRQSEESRRSGEAAQIAN